MCNPGVVASTVIPCNGTVEIGTLDAVNPPHILVCKLLFGTRTELFQLVGDNCTNFSQPILPKGQKRRSERLWNKRFELKLQSGRSWVQIPPREKNLLFRLKMLLVFKDWFQSSSIYSVMYNCDLIIGGWSMSCLST